MRTYKLCGLSLALAFAVQGLALAQSSPAPAATAQPKPAATPAAPAASATPIPIRPSIAPAATPAATPAASPAASPAGSAAPTTAKPPVGAVPPPPANTEAPDPTPAPFDNVKPVTAPSGLTYYDLKVGEGDIPKSGAKVKVNYSGWLTDGKLFDSSVKKGQPMVISLNQVIKGWVEGITTMKVGGKRRLEIPSNLAYGKQGRPGIPPDSDLIFDVELIGIEFQPPSPTPVEGKTPVKKENGLVYYDLAPGSGDTPGDLGRAKMVASMWNQEGTYLWSSSENSKPFQVLLKALPPGWAEGVADMKTGGKRRIEVPAELAFDKPNQFIQSKVPFVVEVELTEVVKPVPQTSVEGIKPVEKESGIKIWDIKVGEGAVPAEGKRWKIQLTTWLKDNGMMVESTRERSEPYGYDPKRPPLPGLTEGLDGMKVGGIRRLELPPAQAYGDAGRAPLIPPNATVICEAELISVEE